MKIEKILNTLKTKFLTVLAKFRVTPSAVIIKLFFLSIAVIIVVITTYFAIKVSLSRSKVSLVLEGTAKQIEFTPDNNLTIYGDDGLRFTPQEFHLRCSFMIVKAADIYMDIPGENGSEVKHRTPTLSIAQGYFRFEPGAIVNIYLPAGSEVVILSGGKTPRREMLNQIINSSKLSLPETYDIGFVIRTPAGVRVWDVPTYGISPPPYDPKITMNTIGFESFNLKGYKWPMDLGIPFDGTVSDPVVRNPFFDSRNPTWRYSIVGISHPFLGEKTDITLLDPGDSVRFLTPKLGTEVLTDMYPRILLKTVTSESSSLDGERFKTRKLRLNHTNGKLIIDGNERTINSIDSVIISESDLSFQFTSEKEDLKIKATGTGSSVMLSGKQLVPTRAAVLASDQPILIGVVTALIGSFIAVIFATRGRAIIDWLTGRNY